MLENGDGIKKKIASFIESRLYSLVTLGAGIIIHLGFKETLWEAKVLKR